jgi:hypothetical protein
LAALEWHFSSAAHQPKAALAPLLLHLFMQEHWVTASQLRRWQDSNRSGSDAYGALDEDGLSVVKSKTRSYVDGLDRGDSESSDSSDSDSDSGAEDI